MKSLHRFIVRIALLLLASASAVQAQSAKDKLKQAELEASRNNPVIVKAFRAVVKRPSEYTVRVLADDKEAALGTIVGADGWVLTKWSEIRDRGKLTCKFKDGKVLEAKLVGVKDDADGAYDLALLKVDAKGLPTVEWRPSSDTAPGRWVASPGLSEDPIAIGIVGVATRQLKPGDQPPKISNDNSGFLGITPVDAMGEGVKISDIVKPSPAAKAGLKKDDIIYEISGRPILDVESLHNTLGRLKAGDKVVLKIKRSEEELEIAVTLAQRNDKQKFGNPQDRMGSELSNRRGGFPFILQHDTVLKPKDCGGPLVDLDGKTVGINIARAGRTETYAIPSEKVIALLPELKSGKLLPELKTSKVDASQVLRTVSSLDATDKRDKKFIKVHEVKLTAGTTYSIEMDSSEFDAFLILEDEAGKKLAEDDDSGGNTNAKIVFTPSADGTYRIVATSFEPNQKGHYTLTVRKVSLPKKSKD